MGERNEKECVEFCEQILYCISLRNICLKNLCAFLSPQYADKNTTVFNILDFQCLRHILSGINYVLY